MNEVEIIRAKRNGDEERLHELLKKDIEYNQELIENLQDEKFAKQFIKNEIEANESIQKHFARFLSEVIEDNGLQSELNYFDEELQMIFAKALIDYLEEDSVEIFQKLAKEVDSLLN